MGLPDTVYVTYIASTSEQVWEALTSPEFTRQYFFGRRMQSDWKVGSPFQLLMEDGTVDCQGKVLESDPPRRLSVTWHVEWIEEMRRLPECIVSFDIESLGDVVRLTMTESHPH